MAEEESLANILGNESPVPKEKEPAEKPAAADPVAKQTEERNQSEDVQRNESRRKQHLRKEYEAQGRDPETGQFTPKEPAKEEPKSEEPKVEPPKVEKAAEPPQQQLTDKERAFLAAAQEERRKRQDLERRLAEMQPPKTAEAPKQFWEDPEAKLADFERKINEVAMTTRLNTSETIARSLHPDFDEKVQVFAQLLQNTPGLQSQWLAEQNPAEFAYRAAKGHMDLQQAGSLDAIRAKIEAETRTKVEAEMKAKFASEQEKARKEREAIPESLSRTPGVRHNAVAWGGPPSLEEILKRN